MKKVILFIYGLFLVNMSFGQTLFTEGWESAANNSNVPPAGWGIDLILGPNITYYMSVGTWPAVTPFEGSRLVDFESFSYVYGTNRLKRTTPVSTIGYSNITVDFEWYTDNGYNFTNEGVFIDWSTDGVNWTQAGTIYKRYATTNQWVLETQALPASADNQPALYIAFRFNSQFGNDCHMDLVHVKAVVPQLPVVTTQPATQIFSNGATLNGLVNSNNLTTSVLFQYGLTSSYGSSVAGSPSPLTGSISTSVTGIITGLLLNTTYHYRVIAINSLGTTNGDDMTFTTTSTTCFIFDDGTMENGFQTLPGYTLWFGNKFIVPPTFSGQIQSFSMLWWNSNAATNQNFQIDVFSLAGVLLGSSQTFQVPIPAPTTFMTVTLTNAIPINGPFYAMVKWAAFSGPTHFLGLDQNGPNASQDIGYYRSGTDFSPINTLTSPGGVFCLRTCVVENTAAPLLLTAAHTNVSCFGGSNGSIDLTVTGGIMPYTYLWSNGATTQDLTGLSIGTYTVTVTDLNGLTATSSAMITQPGPLVVNDSVTQHILCNGGTGCIAAIAGGGQAPYAYHWSNDSTGPSICAHAGIYSVSVTDNNQCTATDSINLPQPSALHINAGENQFVYYGYPPAECATLSWSGASGGVPPYNILWSTGQTSQTITVCPTVTTTYSVTIHDANNCTFSDQVKVCVTDIRCGNNLDKVQICHIPPGNPGNRQTLCVAMSAVPAHLAHGDSLGACGIDRTCTDDKSTIAEITNPLVYDGGIKMEAFPNPFSETATVMFTCPAEGYVTIKLVDQIGRVVRRLFAGNVGKDVNNQIEVDGSHLSQGLYLVVLQHSDGTTKRIKLICTR